MQVATLQQREDLPHTVRDVGGDDELRLLLLLHADATLVKDDTHC